MLCVLKVRIETSIELSKSIQANARSLKLPEVDQSIRESDGEVGRSGEDCLSVVLNKDWIYNNIASTPLSSLSSLSQHFTALGS